MNDGAILLLDLLFVLLFWGAAAWLFLHRNAPEKLSKKVPLIPHYRKRRLHPLFKDRTEVLWFAFWPFLLGAIFLILLIFNWRGR